MSFHAVFVISELICPAGFEKRITWDSHKKQANSSSAFARSPGVESARCEKSTAHANRSNGRLPIRFNAAQMIASFMGKSSFALVILSCTRQCYHGTAIMESH